MYLKLTIVSLFVLSQQFKGILGDGTCPEIPMDICPYGISEYTGESVKFVPKYLTRDHPEYDARTPKEARDKMNLYCAHPACYSHPCLNGATCVEELDGYSCSCLGGYIGIHCEQLVCPVGWVYGHTKCFLIVNSLPDADWTTARDYCNGLDAVTMGNGEMVEPSLLFRENVEEYDLLKPHLNEPRSWLNCKYVNTWKCYTDRAGTKSDYRNWARNKPSTSNTHTCAVLRKDNGLMNNRVCTYEPQPNTVCQVNL